jgi:hypothetical protein
MDASPILLGLNIALESFRHSFEIGDRGFDLRH